MKDYAKRSAPSSPAFNRRRAQNNKNNTSKTADRLLITFIISMCFLACTTGAHGLYEKWKHEHPQLALDTQSTTITTIEKTPEKKLSATESTVEKKHALAEKNKKILAEKAEKPAPTDNQPKYDFYQMLPKMTVDVPKDTDNSKLTS